MPDTCINDFPPLPSDHEMNQIFSALGTEGISFSQLLNTELPFEHLAYDSGSASQQIHNPVIQPNTVSLPETQTLKRKEPSIEGEGVTASAANKEGEMCEPAALPLKKKRKKSIKATANPLYSPKRMHRLKRHKNSL